MTEGSLLAQMLVLYPNEVRKDLGCALCGMARHHCQPGFTDLHVYHSRRKHTIHLLWNGRPLTNSLTLSRRACACSRHRITRAVIQLACWRALALRCGPSPEKVLHVHDFRFGRTAQDLRHWLLSYYGLQSRCQRVCVLCRF